MALAAETTAQAQRQLALAKANGKRTAMADLKARAKRGEDVTERLLEVASNRFVGEVLMSLPGIGEWRAEEIIRTASVSPLRRCRWLTQRQRKVIARYARAAARCPRGDFRNFLAAEQRDADRDRA